MMTCHKLRGDGKEVVGEVVVAVAVAMAAWTVNHEFNAVFFKDIFQEVCGEARQSVFVQDHSLADHAAESSFQKGVQTLALEVDTRAEVADVVVGGVRVLRGFDLTSKVPDLSLFGGANTSVDDAASTASLLFESSDVSFRELAFLRSERRGVCFFVLGAGTRARTTGGSKSWLLL